MLRTLLLPALTLLALVAGLPPAQAATTSLPVVRMSAVVTAAQVEGYRGNQPAIGDDPSTKLVQRALTARGFRVDVDGHFGRATTAAYISYQRSIGYRSIDANGLPGPDSLARLGRNRFTVVDVIQVGSRHDSYGRARVNTRTKLMIAAADRRLPFTLTVLQGSYCTFGNGSCSGASGGTHDGGGTIDIKASTLTTTQRWQTVQALRSVGFAAWLRLPSQCGGCWPYHIHAIAIGDTDLWQKDGRYTNRDQVADYYVGRSGLAGHARDNTPTQYRAAFTTWERSSLAAR